MKHMIFSKTLSGIRVSIASYNDSYPPYARGNKRHYKKGYWRLRVDVLEGHHPLRPGRTSIDLVRVLPSWQVEMGKGLEIKQLPLPDFPLFRIVKYQKLRSVMKRPHLMFALRNLQTGAESNWTVSPPLILTPA